MEIKTVGVVGCGLMGSGIVELAAKKGYAVVVREINDDFLAKGLKRIQDSTAYAVKKEKLTAADRDAVLARIKGTTKMEDLAHVDLAIEAAIENLDLKKSIFEELDRVTRPEIILASNTSSLAVTEMASKTRRNPLFGLERGQQIGDLADHGLVGCGRYAIAAEPFRQIHHTARERHPTQHVRTAADIELKPHHLGRATADINDNRMTVAWIEERCAAGKRQRRLLAAADNVEPNAGLGLDSGDKLGAIVGATAGFRCDSANAADMAAPHFVGTGLERVDRTVHGRLGQVPAGMDAFAEAHYAGECIDDAEAVARRTRDEQPAVIGAEIDGGVGVAEAAAAGTPRTGANIGAEISRLVKTHRLTPGRNRVPESVARRMARLPRRPGKLLKP